MRIEALRRAEARAYQIKDVIDGGLDVGGGAGVVGHCEGRRGVPQVAVMRVLGGDESVGLVAVMG